MWVNFDLRLSSSMVQSSGEILFGVSIFLVIFHDQFVPGEGQQGSSAFPKIITSTISICCSFCRNLSRMLCMLLRGIIKVIR